MNTQVLESFVVSADYGSLSRASAVLGIAQSIISRHIATLESDLGARVFERTGRGVLLTEVGRVLLPHARNLLADVRHLYHEAAALRDVAIGKVSIGVVPGWTERLVGPLTRTVVERLPKVDLRVLEGYSGEIEKWLQTGEVDIGLWNIYKGVARKQRTLSEKEMFLVAPAGSELGTLKELKLRALKGLNFALQTRPNSFRVLLDDHCRKAGFTLSVLLETDSFVAIKEAVTSGGLYGFLPLHVVNREVEAGKVHAIRVVDPIMLQRTILDNTTFRPLSLASTSVMEIMLDIVRNASG